VSGGKHRIFNDHPITGHIDLSTGPAPTPYHVYDGHGTLLIGTCSQDSLQDHYADQDVYPVLTQSGSAIMLIFLCQFAHASHGPHIEFHITALSAPEPDIKLPDDPAAALAALATQPTWGALSLHLWNDSPSVVAYNSEHLGLQAQICQGDLSFAHGKLSFDLTNAQNEPLCTGHLSCPPRSESGLMRRTIRYLGWRGLWAAVRRKPSQAYVINRKGPVLSENGRAKTLTAPDKMVISSFDPQNDRLANTLGPLAAYDLDPQIVEHIWPFRFVYLNPHHAQS